MIKTGLPLLLADLDSMVVQRCILSTRNQGAAITREGAVSTAKALLKKYRNFVRNNNLTHYHRLKVNLLEWVLY